MKKKLYNTILKNLLMGCSLVAMMGCNDFLEITPSSELSPDGYFTAEDQLAAYTIREYTDNFPSFDGQYYADMETDNATTKSTSTRYVPGLWKVGATGGEWNFENIFKANYFLQRAVPLYDAGKITGIQANIKHYIGEGYFIRAYQYYYRLRKLGDFPIIKEVLTDDMATLTEASKRRPRNEVARFIIEDLDKAIALLNNNPAGGKVRITKNAALVFKARVALFEATWEKYHAGTALVPNGPGWPGATKEYNKEYKFPSGSLQGEIDYFLDQALDASSQVADAIQLVANNKVIRESASQPLNQYYDMFASTAPGTYGEILMYRPYDGSLNIGHSYNHHVYYGAGRGYTHQMEQSFLMANGLPVYAAGSGYAGDDLIQDTKIDRDSRWRLFMKAPLEAKTFINTSKVEYFDKAPIVYTSDVKYSTATGYMLGKGFSHDYNMQLLDKDCTANILFRAAEAYLAYIEAYYEKNGEISGKADTYWRAIRARAGVDSDYNKTIVATSMSVEALYDWGAYSHNQLVNTTLYNIRRERRCELMGEGYRYDDLIRWRAMDQLSGFQIEGCKLWGPQRANYDPAKLVYDVSDTKNNVSSPTLSQYMRPYQIVVSKNEYFNGLHFCEAHYLSPISVNHFLITATDGKTVSTSPIYQNPGWPTTANEGAAK